MKRRVEEVSANEGGGSMLKYRREDIDWATIHAETQARLMRSQAAFSFKPQQASCGLGPYGGGPGGPSIGHIQQHFSVQPLNGTYTPSANTPHDSRTSNKPFHQVTPSQQQQQQQQQRSQLLCFHCGVSAANSAMSYMSTQPLQTCHFCEKLACGECCHFCSKCEEVFCRGCLVVEYSDGGQGGVCLTCRY